jgi:hypothetical protein
MLVEKGVIALSILGGSVALAQNIVHQPVNPNGVTQVHTALDHISILGLPERITRVAAGSDAMQIEWHDNSVFIKPLKAGQSTNLMVWTEHQMSTYELEAPGDVHNMSFLIDETASIPQAHAQSATSPTHEEMQRVADSVIGATLLQVTPVVPSHGLRPAKDYVSVVIKEVVRDNNSLYVRFAVTNSSSHPYRIISPNVFTIVPTKRSELLRSMKNLQIPEQATYEFQSNETAQVPVRAAAIPQKDVAPGATADGVLTLATSDKAQSGVYEFVFGNDGTHRIQATAVL